MVVQHGGCGHCAPVGTPGWSALGCPRDIPRNADTRRTAHFAHTSRPSSPHGVPPHHEQEQLTAGPRSARLLPNDPPGHRFGAGRQNPAGCQQRVGEQQSGSCPHPRLGPDRGSRIPAMQVSLAGRWGRDPSRERGRRGRKNTEEKQNSFESAHFSSDSRFCFVNRAAPTTGRDGRANRRRAGPAPLRC